MILGVISDTHGLVRPEALLALSGCERILHAGDVGRLEVVKELEKIAPVVAIRGNVDRGPWADRLPVTATVEAGEAQLYMLHDISRLDIDPVAAGLAAIIYGHSHHTAQEIRNGVLYLNPGSAGPLRFGLPASVARLRIEGQALSAEFVYV